MPTRYLKESICTSENIDLLSPFAETVFYRLMVNCDDFGRFDARPKILSARLFPLKDDMQKEIASALKELELSELITLYIVDGKPYLQMQSWSKHQTTRAKTSKYPSPDDGIGQHLETHENTRQHTNADDNTVEHLHTDADNCMQMQADDDKFLRNRNRISESESKSKSSSESNNVVVVSEKRDEFPWEDDSETVKQQPQKRKQFVKPTIEELNAYILEKGYTVDAEKFFAYYESNGWMVGKNHMKDWKSALVTWQKKENEKPSFPRRITTVGDVAKIPHRNPFAEMAEAGDGV